MEFLKDGFYMGMTGCVGDQSGGIILNYLKAIYEVRWCSCEKAVMIVQSGYYS